LFSSISADGRYIAFESLASNLVPKDTNTTGDIFRYTIETGVIEIASVDSSGMQANGYSHIPAISADGRYIAFESLASNLVSEDTNEYPDIFVHDLETDVTTRVSVDSSGRQANAHSYISAIPSISGDGRFIAFPSIADNLVPDDTNMQKDIFVHDMQSGITTRISVDSNGVQSNSGSDSPVISADGRFVAFSSGATNLVEGDTNVTSDLFMHDMQSGITTRISVDSNGVQANFDSYADSISANGRFIAFTSRASNLVPNDTNSVADIFLHDQQTGMTTRISTASDGTQANDHSTESSISGDGRYIVFSSRATNLVPDDTNMLSDVFLHDRQTGTTTRVSVDSGGTQAVIESDVYYVPMLNPLAPSTSADGQYVVFTSYATNLVLGDTNMAYDIFIHRLDISTDTAIPSPTLAGLITDTPIPTETVTPTVSEPATETPTLQAAETATATSVDPTTSTPTPTDTETPAATPFANFPASDTPTAAETPTAIFTDIPPAP
jgi:hypothetical protein